MNHLESLIKSTFTMPYVRPSKSPSQVVQEENFTGEWWNPLPESITKRIQGKSYNEQCPVPLTDLAYIRVTHWNFKDEMSTGELIVHKNLAQEITAIFLELFEAHFPINQMVLIDEYDANDELSMEANNSSAFCVHEVTGNPGTLSKHR